MPKQGKERANGPYQHGTRWRVVFTGANGVSETESFESKAEAIAHKDAFNAAAGCRTLDHAVTEYLQEKEQREDVKYRLRGIFRLDEGDRPLNSVTPTVALALYRKRVEEVAAATQQSELGYARRFFQRQIELGRLKANPFDGIKKEGKKNKGKPKLRVNGTRTLLEVLLPDDSKEAIAVLTCLTLALRASAVVGRTVADLDDNGWLLWVRNNKTAAGDMEIEVPAFLRTKLLKLAEGKKPTDKLFGDMTRWSLWRQTINYCKRAGVDRVTPHGLRGSAATMAVRAGQAIEAVAAQVGHADKGITLKGHYLGGGAIESGRARGIETLIAGNESPGDVTNQQNQEVN